MSAVYFFFGSLGGIVILLSLKTWEISRGAKPFSVLRYRLDILVREGGEKFRHYISFINTTTLRVTLAFLVAKVSHLFSLGVGKIKESKPFMMVKGKLLPPEGTGTVSAFLKDVAEFKKEAANKTTEEEQKREVDKTPIQ